MANQHRKPADPTPRSEPVADPTPGRDWSTADRSTPRTWPTTAPDWSADRGRAGAENDAIPVSPPVGSTVERADPWPSLEEVLPGEVAWTRDEWANLSTVDGQPSLVEDEPVAEPAPPPPDGIAAVRAAARVATWCLPLAAVVFGVSVLAAWPHSTAAASPGTWVLLTAASVMLTLLGALGVTVLLVPTAGRAPALAGLLTLLAGTALAAPVAGVVGLARPAVQHLGSATTIAFDADLASGPAVRGIALAGLLLLGAGWTLLACAILVSNRFSRGDGYLLLFAVGLATAGILVRPVLAIAALAALAAGLGLAFTATRSP
jgi:hypothetical protein